MKQGMAVVAVLVGLMVGTTSAPALLVMDETAGRVILCRPFPTTEPVTLSFTHSMYGGEVRETFLLAGGTRLRRVAVTTANAAAAEYYAYVANVIRDGDRYRVALPAAEFTEILVRVDRVGNHQLTFDDRAIDLVAAAGDRHQVRLGIRPSTLVARLTGGACREGLA